MGVVFCDLDDVIADTEKIIVKYARKYTCEVLGRSVEDEYDGNSSDYFYFVERFKWNEEELRDFFARYYPDYLKEISCIAGSREYITKIMDEGHEFNIISARYPSEKTDVYLLTKEWLKKNEIPYTNLYINQQKKDSIISKCSDVLSFIDDSVQNCKDICEMTDCNHTILLVKQYNRKIPLEGCDRAETWKDIYEIICEKQECN